MILSFIVNLNERQACSSWFIFASDGDIDNRTALGKAERNRDRDRDRAEKTYTGVQGKPVTNERD